MKDAGHLQVDLVTDRRKGWRMMEIGRPHRLWTAMVGHYLRQTDVAHLHHPKIRPENLKDRTSIQTDGHEKAAR